MLIFLFVDKRKLFAMTLSFEEFNLVFYGISAKQVIWKCIFILMRMKLIITKRLNALSLVLKVTVFGTWKPAYWAMSSWWATLWVPGVEQNNPGYLKEFLVNYCSLSRLITKHDNVLLQFTRARLITIYDNVLLQFTSDITIYDDCYHDLRQVLQFTTENSLRWMLLRERILFWLDKYGLKLSAHLFWKIIFYY